MTRKEGHNSCCDFCKVLCAPCMPCCVKCCFCCFPPTNGEYPNIIYSSVIQQEKYSTDGESDGEHQREVNTPVTKIFQTLPTFEELSPDPQLGGDKEGFGRPFVITEQPRDIISKLHKSDDFIFCTRDLDEDGDDDEDGHRYEKPKLTLSIQSATYFSTPSDDHTVEDPNRGHVDIGKITRTPEPTLDRRCPSYRSLRRTKSAKDCKEEDFFAELKRKLKQEISIPEGPKLPCIHYTLYYSKENACLTVHISKAVFLSTIYKVDSSNPFVMAYLLPSKSLVQQSPMVQGTHNPVFNYVFKFCGVDFEVAKQMLVIKLYINNVNHFIGGVIHQLENTDHFGKCIVREITQFDELSSSRAPYQGDLLITLCFKSETRILEVMILEACNLRKAGTPGIPNPYIKVNLIYQGQRISKSKTSRTKERRIVNPVINEKCKLLLPTKNTEDFQIDIVVMSYDRFGHNHVIGSVSMGEQVSHESGQKHWRETMLLNDTPCTYWHAVLTSVTACPLEKMESKKSL